MDEDIKLTVQLTYILKIVAGVLLAAAIAFAAFIPGAHGWSAARTLGLVAALIGAACGGGALLWRRYRKLDELHRSLHHASSALAMAAVVLGAGIVGILQANGLMPVVNQFWFFAAIIAVWGVCLMLVDRRFQ